MRWRGGGQLQEFRAATRDAGYYWHRQSPGDLWHIARLEDYEPGEELIRVWSLLGGGEDDWMPDAGMARHDVEGPIPEPT